MDNVRRGIYGKKSKCRDTVCCLLNEQSESKKLSTLSPSIASSAVAGWNGIDVDGVNPNDCERIVVPDFTEIGAEFLIRAKGNSMYPTYSNGDILACRRVRETRNIQWNKVYVIDSAEGPMVKRLKKSDDENSILCCSDNPDFDPFELQKDEIRSLSLVVGSIQID